MATFQDVIDRALVALNDDGTRYANLIVGANDAMAVVRTKRPDLFYGTFSTPFAGTYTAGDQFPLERQFLPALVSYVCAWAEQRDNEDAFADRAKDFLALFNVQVS